MSFDTASTLTMPIHSFQDFNYTRPDINKLEAIFRKILETFQTAKTFSVCETAIDAINDLRYEIDTMYSIAMIRYNGNTSDSFYANESHYFDTHLPIYQNLILEFYIALNNSKYKNKIRKKWGNALFNTIDCVILSNSPVIIEELKEENQLSSQYNRLIASARIPFNAEEKNIADINVFEQHTDRGIRKDAAEAKWNFFSNNENKLDSIYDNLVKTRHNTAQKLGFTNFIELAYARYNRTDYKPGQVALYRKQIKDVVVPLIGQIYSKRAKRIEIDNVKYYDSAISFKSGNAKLQGNFEWLMNTTERMFSELSPETGVFFKYMKNKGLMDLVSRKDKAFRGYCTWLGKYKSPFIFANFNGTSNDVRVLIHELGHAFQKYHSKHYKLPEYTRPTLEACEIHSMSLEFLTWPWMNLFFGQDAEKYRYAHLCAAVTLLAYSASIDEFQHVVYANPGLSPKERKLEWKKIEKTYMPYNDYEGNDFLNGGGYWQQQSHVYTKPFYYIDYALAQICALQFWNRSTINFEQTWADYMKICKVGGSMSFSEILTLGNLKSPFEEGCIEATIKPVIEWFNNIDDLKL